MHTIDNNNIQLSHHIETNEEETGHFFQISINAIKHIIKLGGTAEDIISYLVLARHTIGTGEWKHILTTAGANAIHNKTTISYRKATALLNWLADNHLIKSVENSDAHDIPKHFGKIKTRNTTIRWALIDYGEPLVYLSNTLIDGTNGRGKLNPPLARLLHSCPINDIDISDIKLDTISVLLHMYLYHELVDYGGINPLEGVYNSWKNVPNQIDTIDIDVYDLPISFYEIEQDTKWAYWKFIDETLFYIEDQDQRSKRFWNAFHYIKQLGYFYEIIQIWNGNPFENKKAEMLYPLYILDRHAKETEPYLAKEIHNTLINLEIISGMEINDFFENINTGTYRYIVPKGYNHFPLGIYRLRFRPKNRDTSLWFEIEKEKALKWQEYLEMLSKSTSY